jgi:[CysO sulfur-carrier protein]-S-L-cysteine hydrolase
MLDTLILSRIQLRDISTRLTTCLPEEACGLLIGGSDGRVESVIHITNMLHSPTRFRMDEMELFHALQILDQTNNELLGIFHSHPAGPNHPSFTDLAEYQYPDSFMVIFTPTKRSWSAKAYQFIPVVRSYKEIKIMRI